MTRLKPATVLIRWLRVSTGSYGLFSKKPSDPTTGVRRKRRTPLAAKSEYRGTSITAIVLLITFI